jgi:hypothetical protein
MLFSPSENIPKLKQDETRMKNPAVSVVGAMLLSALSVGAHATTVAIAADGGWNEFDVDSSTAISGGVEWIDNVSGPGIPQYQGDGSALSFTFTLATQAVLKVVDAGFAGDQFQIFDGATSLGLTSSVQITEFNNNPPNVGTDFDAAYADHTNFSFFSLLLNPGTYTITGALTQSMNLGGLPLNATVGALSVTPVPLPAALPLMLSGLGLLGGSLRRRAIRRAQPTCA